MTGGGGPEATVGRLVAADPSWLAPLDVQAARVLGDLAGEPGERARLALALVSRQVRHGHVCLDLPALAAGGGPMDEAGQRLGDLAWPELGGWLAALAASPLVATAADDAGPEALPPTPVPLVLARPSGRLYLRRWWEHEAHVARALGDRAAAPPTPATPGLEAALGRLFPPVAGEADRGRRDQAAAAALAARRRLAVITGGPGTGKTTTVVRLLALLAEQAQEAGLPAPRSLLLAPTGKAAARLEASMTSAVARLPASEAVKAAIPTEAGTLHRALGPRPDGSWRNGAANPLGADAVVVDEASMVDMALLRALLDALRPETRLVLLGDRDQLASVDAGAVLADLCGDGAGAPAIAGCIARLGYSFRFGPGTGIGALGRAINAGRVDEAFEVLDNPEYGDVTLVEKAALTPRGGLLPELAALVDEAYGPAFARLGPGAGAADIAAALAALDRLRVLAAHRRGPSGVLPLGEAIVASLAAAGHVAPHGEAWPGRPILVNRNDDALGIYNGDVGLIAPDSGDGGRLRAFFPGAGGSLRPIAAPRLPPHETAFAISIHKSQGSEFDRVAIVLPAAGSPLLSRELVYTAVTRARTALTLFAHRDALAEAIGRRAERTSGLRQRLWGN